VLSRYGNIVMECLESMDEYKVCSEKEKGWIDEAI